MASNVEIFFCYAREDEPLVNKLKKYLRTLSLQGLVNEWHDREIDASIEPLRGSDPTIIWNDQKVSSGEEWGRSIRSKISNQVFLLLISSDFVSSDYCYSIEMQRILDMHSKGKIQVIPVILRPVYWQKTPFAKLQALPTDARPITSSTWHNLDEALFDVAIGISKNVLELSKKSSNDGEARAATETVQPTLLALENASRSDKFKLLRTLETHSDYVSCVALHPDGRTLASGSWDRTIKLWNLHTGQLLHSLSGHSGYINSIAFSHDGQLLASGSDDDSIKLWNLHTLKPQTLTSHTEDVSTVAISSDCRTLVSGSWDKTIKQWELPTGKLRYTLKGHLRYVLSAAISPDGRFIASGSNDGVIKIWYLHSGKLLRTLTAHANTINAIAMSPDGRTIVTGDGDNTIKVWRWEWSSRKLFGIEKWFSSGTLFHNFSVNLLHTLIGHSKPVYSIAMSPDGKTIVSGSGDNTIKIWNALTGEVVETLTDHNGEVRAVAISTDGLTLVSGSYDGTVKIWSLR